MSENSEQPKVSEAEVEKANAEAAKQYQLALEASANMIKKDLIDNLVQILNADPLRKAADCQKELAEFLQKYTIPNTRYLLSAELNSASGECILVVPEVQFKLEIVDGDQQVAN